MSRSIRTIVVASLVLMIMMGMRFSAWAGVPKLETSLTGPAIAGLLPEGQAKAFLGASPSLFAKASDVKLANGTVVEVILDGKSMGTFTLTKKKGSLTVPLGSTVVRTDSVIQYKANGNVILSASVWRRD